MKLPPYIKITDTITENGSIKLKLKVNKYHPLLWFNVLKELINGK